jgi:NhaP-type Na+/H+ or K+/H+ antiporter
MWMPVLTWGGLRGVLALSLPAEAGNTPLIVAMTAGTVVLSLVGQGATMPLLLRRLGIAGAPDDAASD